MNTELKLKKGDLVGFAHPVLGQIMKIDKRNGYTIRVFASNSFVVSCYDDNDVYKVAKNSEWARESVKQNKLIEQKLTK